jgi:DNA uptake protein ComE-like DNA-binding protein
MELFHLWLRYPDGREDTMKFMRLVLSVTMSALLFSAAVLSQVPPPIAGAVEAAQVDINSALGPELEALPGIGPKYVQKIIIGRPYKRKDELVKKGIIPQATYDKIKDKIGETEITG